MQHVFKRVLTIKSQCFAIVERLSDIKDSLDYHAYFPREKDSEKKLQELLNDSREHLNTSSEHLITNENPSIF